MSKLLFADIDGVFNSLAVSRIGVGRTAKKSVLPGFDPMVEFEPRCVAEFNRIVTATDAKLVISSSWRNLVHGGRMNLLGFETMLRTHGIRGEVIGVTRASREDNEEGREPRSMQIADWLRETRTPSLDYRAICILDDDPTAFGHMPGVQTNGTGLTSADADLAIHILTGER